MENRCNGRPLAWKGPWRHQRQKTKHERDLLQNPYWKRFILSFTQPYVSDFRKETWYAEKQIRLTERYERQLGPRSKKLRKTRSRLYRSRFCKRNSCCNIFRDIYILQIFAPLWYHTSSKNTTNQFWKSDINFSQHFAICWSTSSLPILMKNCRDSKFHQIWGIVTMSAFNISPNFRGIVVREVQKQMKRNQRSSPSISPDRKTADVLFPQPATLERKFQRVLKFGRKRVGS